MIRVKFQLICQTNQTPLKVLVKKAKNLQVKYLSLSTKTSLNKKKMTINLKWRCTNRVNARDASLLGMAISKDSLGG